MSINFIHTADIHLGSSLHTVSPADEILEEKFNYAVIRSFKKITDFALKKNVDFIIISGDLFDSDERSVKAIKTFNKEAKKLKDKNIDIYLIAGNHDPLNDNKSLFTFPENVHFFASEKVETKEFKENNKLKARIIGQSYRGSSDSRKMYSSYLAPDQGVFNIALLHTQLDPNNNNYVPCTVKDLIKKDAIDYWALGHIHKNKVLRSNNPAVVYPGIPQGRDFGESGLKGFYFVELHKEKEAKVNFIPTSNYIWKEIDIVIPKTENIKTVNGIINYIKNKAISIFIDNKNSDIEKYDINLKDITYIIRWNLKIESISDNDFKEDKEEIETYILDELREKLSVNKYTIWSEDINLEFANKFPLEKDLINKDELFKEIVDMKEEIINSKKLITELKDSVGDIWQGSNDPEDLDEYRFDFENEANDIIGKAEEKILSRLWEKRGE